MERLGIPKNWNEHGKVGGTRREKFKSQGILSRMSVSSKIDTWVASNFVLVYNIFFERRKKVSRKSKSILLLEKSGHSHN